MQSFDRFQWLNALFACPHTGPFAKAAGAYLFARANDGGECWPSVATIAGGVSRSKNNTKKALDELAAAGWIGRSKRTHAKGFQYCYALAIPPEVVRFQNGSKGSRDDPSRGHAMIPQGVTAGPLRGHGVTDKGSRGEHKQTKEQTKEQTSITTPAKPPRSSPIISATAERVIVQVENETRRTLTGLQAEKLLAATKDDPIKAAEAFIDMHSNYERAAPYKLIEFAISRIKKDRQREADNQVRTKRPRNAYDGEHAKERQARLERILANAQDVPAT